MRKILILIILIFSSCSTKKDVLLLQDIKNSSEYSFKFKSIKIQPDDILKIKISSKSVGLTSLYNPQQYTSGGISIEGYQLEGYVVNSEGYINIPSLSPVLVKGLTLIEASKKIRNLLKEEDVLRNATVDIKILNAYFTVIGEVNAPGRYFFLENELKKLKQLDQKNISLQDCKKILTFDTNNKAGIFFYILKKNNQIINIYRNKIISNEDASEFYFYCKSYCALILNSKDESDFIKAVPKYLFREKSIFLEIFKKYNQKKRGELIRLIDLTDKNIRLRSSFTKMLVIRFVLNLRKITIS